MSSFLFERDFDLEIEAEGQDPAPPVLSGPDPARLAEMMRQAREEAFEQGRAQGAAEAEASLREGLLANQAASLAALLPQIEALSAHAGAHRLQMERDLAALTLFLAQNLMPEVLERFGAARVKAFVRQSLRMAEGGLDIRLSTSMHEALSPEFAGLTTAGGATVTFGADAELSLHEARASWVGGGAKYDYQRIWDALLNNLKTLADGTGS